LPARPAWSGRGLTDALAADSDWEAAVTTAARSDVLPDAPTVGDVVPGFEASTWYGLGAPRNTPPELIDRLSREVNAVFAEPQTKARMAGLGSSPLILSPAELGQLIADETETWGKVVKASGIRAN
jgi:tripartite-type tricarboxylate transporter receptor subunit TctC